MSRFRIRTVKPEFYGDEKLAPLAVIHRFVFKGLWSYADDAGRLVDSVKAIDGFLFPATADTCRESLEVLASLGVIVRYVAQSGQRLIQITNWRLHQRVDKPSSYLLPAPSDEAISRARRDALATLSRDSRAGTLDLRPTTKDLKSGGTRETAHARAAAFDEAVRTPRRSIDTLLDPVRPGVVQFWRRHYEHADPIRQLDVAEQLRALHDGQQLTDDGGQSVQAYSPDRLEAKCREVSATALKDPNTAIVVLFRKLGDTSDVTELLETRDTAEADEAERIGTERQVLVDAWVREHPDDAEAIRASLKIDLPGDSLFAAQSREWAFVSEVLQHLNASVSS